MSSAPTPSAGEMKLFYFILKHCKTKPDVDWSAVATDCGLKNADVAKTRYGQVRRKLENNLGGGGDGSAPAPKPTPTKGSGVKKAAGRVGARAKTTKKTTARQIDLIDTDDADFLPSTPVKVKKECIVKNEEEKPANQAMDWMEELAREENQTLSLFG